MCRKTKSKLSFFHTIYRIQQQGGGCMQPMSATSTAVIGHWKRPFIGRSDHFDSDRLTNLNDI